MSSRISFAASGNVPIASRRLRDLVVLGAVVAGALLGTAASPARTLSWRALEVTARLDADGRLHVSERHVLVFDGDWNGGERSFRLDFGQELDFLGMVRETPQGPRELTAGSLDEVDHYDWTDRRTLRWRSRRSQDPPFAQQEIAYRLDYVLSGILVERGETYLLDHDFAFPDRQWPVERFTLELELDPAWQAPRRPDFSPRPLPAGVGFVVTLPLSYVGATAPAAVHGPAPAIWRLVLATLLPLALAFGVWHLLVHERSRGRFGGGQGPDGEAIAPATIDRAWLEEHVFSLSPELVGAVWDERTGAAEVAALLARLELEGKISSRVEGSAGLMRRPEMHLTLRVPEGELIGDERALIKALFFGATETSTARIQKHYRSRGFQPASKLGATTRRARTFGGGRAAKPPSRWPAAAGSIVGIGLLAAGSVATPSLLPAVIGAVGTGLALYGLAAAGAVAWRHRVHGLVASALFFAIPLGLLLAVMVALLASELPLGRWVPAGLVALAVAATISVLNLARSRQSKERLLLRRRLAAARELLRRELDRPQPELEDAWIPWLLALDLGKDVDRWSVAAAGSHHGRSDFDTMPRSVSSASVAAGSASGGFTGGGGRFGGAGATASWSIAAAGIASGVAAPSSSGGGGSSSGGGGSSSGGGGGGGW